MTGGSRQILLEAAARLMRTVRPLKARQVADRILRHIRPARSVEGPLPARGVALSGWVSCPGRKQHLVLPTQFRFAGIEDDLAICGWNDASKPRLWIYNAHYFDDLRDGAIPDDVSVALVRTWIAENPVGQGAGWEPYTLSLRIVNWIIWVGTRGIADEIILQSVAHQIRFLKQRIEYHLLGNHLLANAKALVFAGCFFTGAEADAWLSEGLDLLAREHKEQILGDGAHFELSPMYHAIILEDVLDLAQLASLSGSRIPEAARAEWVEIAARMTGWLCAMTHPDGEIPFFNDAAMGIAPKPSDLVAYAQSLGVAVAGAPLAARLSASGYRRLENETFCLLFDGAEIGPSYLPGHAHADTLSLELSVDGCRVIVNGGTSTYEPGPVREFERSTAAHATLEIDGANSSEVWASFRVGRRARIIDRHDGACNVSAAHDGYRYLSGSPVHRRTIAMKGSTLVVRDDVSGEGLHDLRLVWPIHPSVHVDANEHSGAFLQLPNERRLQMSIEAGGAELSVQAACHAPEFGVVEASASLVVATRSALPASIETRFEVLG